MDPLSNTGDTASGSKKLLKAVSKILAAGSPPSHPRPVYRGPAPEQTYHYVRWKDSSQEQRQMVRMTGRGGAGSRFRPVNTEEKKTEATIVSPEKELDTQLTRYPGRGGLGSRFGSKSVMDLTIPTSDAPSSTLSQRRPVPPPLQSESLLSLAESANTCPSPTSSTWSDYPLTPASAVFPPSPSTWQRPGCWDGPPNDPTPPIASSSRGRYNSAASASSIPFVMRKFVPAPSTISSYSSSACQPTVFETRRRSTCAPSVTWTTEESEPEENEYEADEEDELSSSPPFGDRPFLSNLVPVNETGTESWVANSQKSWDGRWNDDELDVVHRLRLLR